MVPKLISKHLGMAALSLIVAMGFFSYKSASAASCDVISEASVKILQIQTTTTSATINWKEAHGNDNRYFCYGTTPQTNSCRTKVENRSSHITIMSGLTPSTKYYYIFYGVGHGKTTTTTGSLFTDGSTCVTANSNQAPVNGVVLDQSNDSLEGVVVSVSKTSGGTALAKDTTSTSGLYNFTLDAGVYFLSFVYPPFTSPSPLSIDVKAKTALTAQTQKLSGAYQVGGTIIGTKNDSIVGATVTITSITDPTQTSIRKTDGDGHYNFGLKPGAYTLNATNGTVKLSSPKSITVVDKAIHVEALTMATTVALRRGIASTKLSKDKLQNANSFKVNGSRLDQKQKIKPRNEVFH